MQHKIDFSQITEKVSKGKIKSSLQVWVDVKEELTPEKIRSRSN